jgi:hypothetical protein
MQIQSAELTGGGGSMFVVCDRGGGGSISNLVLEIVCTQPCPLFLEYTRIVHKIGYDCFLTFPFSFIIQQSTWHSAQDRLNS